MNLANAKGITIPEGAVKALSIGGVKVWEKVSAPDFDKYSWEGVIASMDAGTYAADYAIGDCVPLDLGSEGVINMQIAAFDADNLADGSGKAKITWIAKELLATRYMMNPSLSSNIEGTGSIGGWEKSAMRAYMKNTIKPLIPDNVRNAIKEVTKLHSSYNTSGSPVSQTTTDDIWIPSSEEVFGANSTYYGLFQDTDENRAKDGGSWWLRSAASKYRFSQVLTSGAKYLNESCSSAYGVCLCFCT